MNRFIASLAACAAALLSPHALAQAPAAGAASAADATSKFAEVPATSEHLAALKQGGYVLYLRHGLTDNGKPDRVPSVDLNDCSTQRPLLEEGRQTSAMVGASLRKVGVPVGDIRVSPLCRAKESAAAAFPNAKPTVDPDLIYLANLTTEQKAPVIANTRRWLSEPVPAGTNRVVVAHAPNLMELIGYFPKESTLVIVRPRGNGAFEYVASVPPALWASLIKP